MRTTTEHIPCPKCGTTRPLAIRRDADLRRAVTRLCRSCARNPTPTNREPVPCPQCGIQRPLVLGRKSERTRALTRLCRRCSQTPLDIDEMAVERLVIGQPTNATPAERREAVAYLTRRRLSASAIAERIGCTKRTVERHRQRLAS